LASYSATESAVTHFNTDEAVEKQYNEYMYYNVLNIGCTIFEYLRICYQKSGCGLCVVTQSVDEWIMTRNY